MAKNADDVVGYALLFSILFGPFVLAALVAAVCAAISGTVYILRRFRWYQWREVRSKIHREQLDPACLEESWSTVNPRDEVTASTDDSHLELGLNHQPNSEECDLKTFTTDEKTLSGEEADLEKTDGDLPSDLCSYECACRRGSLDHQRSEREWAVDLTQPQATYAKGNTDRAPDFW